MSIDLGTGDGRLPYVMARKAPQRLFIGVDANAAALRETSGRAFRAGARNLLYVRAAVEDLPAELAGAADRVTVVLPWGSLLAAVALPTASALAGIRGLCQPDARLCVVLGIDPERDRAECVRLGLPTLDAAYLKGPLAAAYATVGFRVTSVRSLAAERLAQWPSTWARRLAHGRARPVLQIEAVATPPPTRRPASVGQAGSRGGRPNRGNSVSVSRNDVQPAMRSPESSSTTSAHGACPPSGLRRYWPKAGEPQDAVGRSREPRQPEPRPPSHPRTASGPRSHSA